MKTDNVIIVFLVWKEPLSFPDANATSKQYSRTGHEFS